MPLKVHLVGRADQFRNYSLKMVAYWLRRHGAQIVAEDESPHLVGCNVSHISDLPVLVRAHSVGKKAGCPVVVGGHEAYTGSVLLRWADYVCVGEGYGLLAALAQAGEDYLDVLRSASNVISRDDATRDVTPDYQVPWKSIPIIRTADKAYYALAGRGCHRKCKFCMTSWVQPHQTASDRQLSQMRAAAEAKKCGVVFVTNDSGIGSWAGSITAKQLMKATDAQIGQLAQIVRIGVEGLSEKRRRWFGKPISDEDIAAIIDRLGRAHRQLQLFFIIGFPDDPHSSDAFTGLRDLIPVEPVRHPRIYVKCTYFEPSPHTPLARWDVSQLTSVNVLELVTPLRARSGRFRMFPTAPVGRAAWAAIARRMSIHTIAQWMDVRRSADKMGVVDVCEAAERIAGKSIVDGSGTYAWESVKTAIRMQDAQA